MAKRRRNSGAAKAVATPQAKAPKAIEKSPKGKSPKKRKVKKAAKRLSQAPALADDSSLNIEILRQVATKLAGTPGLIKLGRVSRTCKMIADKEITAVGAKTIDVAELANGKNPLVRKFYDAQERQDALKFHEEVRRVVNLTQNLVDGLPGTDNVLKNFSVRGLGWEYVFCDSEMRRCPPLLQKKMVKLVKKNFTMTVEFEYAKAFVRPSRFFAMFKHRLESITKLDLGDMKALKAIALRSTVFPRLVNLKEFIWHRAELWLVNALPSPQKLESLCLTLSENNVDAESLSILLNCQGLKEIYTGFCVPENPTRFDWDVLLRSYQAFWNQRQYIPGDMLVDKGLDPVPIPEGKDAEYAYAAFPRLRKAGFWNTPEYLFVIMGKLGISYDEVQLGLLSQEQNKLCSLDSLMQALFKYNQPKYSINKLSIDHLKLYTHSMPVISLDYYLPNLMVALGQVLPSLKTLDLFVHCLAASSGMPSSWLLENSRPRRPRALFEDLTHFSFHMDGFCLLDDLDTYLPPSIQSVTLSFIAPKENRRRFLASLVKFIEFLGDFNRFPDLDELHIQVWGVACFEQLLNTVVDHLHGLRRLSLICHPLNKQLSSVTDLIGHSVNKCNKLVEFNISAELVNELLTEAEKSDVFLWRSALYSLGVRCGITSNCELSTKSFPLAEGWNRFVVKPIEPPEEKVTEEGEDEETSSSDDLTDDDEEIAEPSEEEEDDDELDSFVVDEDDVEFEESEDELDKAERELEGESNKREKHWQKNRARIVSDCSENPDSDHNEDEVVVFRRGEQPEDELDEDEEENQNSFFDDMAEEKDGSTSEGGETEPEGEDLEGSDDEDLFVAQAEMVNARARRPPPPKRRRIIDSDDSE